MNKLLCPYVPLGSSILRVFEQILGLLTTENLQFLMRAAPVAGVGGIGKVHNVLRLSEQAGPSKEV